MGDVLLGDECEVCVMDFRTWIEGAMLQKQHTYAYLFAKVSTPIVRQPYMLMKALVGELVWKSNCRKTAWI